MKKYFWVLLYILSSYIASAQKSEDIFTKNDYTFTWYGIDYSHVMFVGDVTNPSADKPVLAPEIKNKYFHAWNQLILDEKDKYNISAMLHRKGVIYDTEMITLVNAATSDAQIQPVESATFYTKVQIQEFINAYDLEKDTSGVGIVFIAESMNKFSREAYYHVVLFNKHTKEILIQKHLRGVPDGVGFRNYWARSFFVVMEDIKEDRYNAWKKQYAPNAPASNGLGTSGTATPQKPLW